MQKFFGKSRNNRGSAMVIIIVVIAFVSILVSTLFSLTTMNIQMKSVDRKAKGNFYSAEGALEQINLGLQNEISEASKGAYAYVMQNYAGNATEAERRNQFNLKFLAALNTALQQDSDPTKYKKDTLEAYLDTDLASDTVLDSTKSWEIVQETDALILKGLEITYTDAQNFQTVIETDIRLKAPNMNLVHSADMPDLFEYTIVANKGLQGNATTSETKIGANVFAGNGGFNDINGNVSETGLRLDGNARWKFHDAKRVVIDGDIEIPVGADFTALSDMDLWADEIQVSGGTMSTRGRTFVSDDLLMERSGSNVTLAGEYYGYGNGVPVSDGSIVLSPGTDSSAILVNGKNSTLDMRNIRKLLLSGSAQISTGSAPFDQDDLNNLKPENDPSWDELRKKDAVLATGAYTIESDGAAQLVASKGDCLQATTALPAEGDPIPGDDAPERFILVRNSDGTISFQDRVEKKYLTLSPDGSGALIPAAGAIGENEKFYAYTLEGMVGYVVLQSKTTNKYVTVEPSETVNGAAKTNVLCANRDKITDKWQLFRIQRIGEVPEIPPVDPPITHPDQMVTFTFHNNAVITVSLSAPDWKENVSAGDAQAWITYSDASADGGWVSLIPMTMSDGGQRAKTTIPTGSGSQTINYRIYYTLKGHAPITDINAVVSDPEIQLFENVFNPNGRPIRGNGNSADMNGLFANGVYTIQRTIDGNFASVTGSTGDGPLAFNKAVTSDSDPSVRFLLINNDDGTITFRSIMGNTYYLSIGTDGNLTASAPTVGVNEKFTVKYVDNEVDNSFYWLQTLPESNGGGKYVAKNGSTGTKLLTQNEAKWDRDSYFVFQWIGYTDKLNPIPPVDPEPVLPSDIVTAHMTYNTETSSKADFGSFHWATDADVNVKMSYKVRDKNGLDKTVSTTLSRGANADAKAHWILEGLAHMDKVTYWFAYTYTDGEGTHTVNPTTKYVYIHETEYGDPISVPGGNVDINLGESVEIKSNQIAYLVPPECIGVNDGEALVGKNPMTATEYTRLENCKKNTTRYPDFKMVDFDKKMNGSNKSLSDYLYNGRTPETSYRRIFMQTAQGTMVYFYVDFDTDGQSEYFRDYYDLHKDSLEGYMKDYLSASGIRLNPADFERTSDGNLLYMEDNNSIFVKSNVYHGWKQTVAEKNSQRNEETGYLKSYKALAKNLILDYSELTPEQKARDLFDNLINSTAVGTMPHSVNATPWEADDAASNSIYALVVNNAGLSPYVYNSTVDSAKEVRMIIATGDVVLAQDFSGIVIAKGTVTVQGGVQNIDGNKEDIFRLLQVPFDPTAAVPETFVAHFFVNGSQYALENSSSGADLTAGDYVPLDRLVTYEEWTKR